ncbi:MAG: YeeE/YedE family protein [Gammaproteobacteria bacterium]|nr:YeeE/YedE family protein [Gammaproteobacteria bacterium]
MRLPIAYFIGLIFGVGISLSGMANPAKVLNFFDVAGSWDPSLGFVMGGAVLITFIGYRWVLSRTQPVYESKFSLPSRTDIDLRLIGGALLFGIGWGITGFCPGGALPVLGTGNTSVLLFVVAMLIGIIATRYIDNVLSSRVSASLDMNTGKL